MKNDPPQKTNWKSDYRLPRWERSIWLVALLLVGLVPSLLFFIWVERQASLPVVGQILGFPWWSNYWDSLPATLAWNSTLCFLFCFVHSALAGRTIALLPPQTKRAFNVILSGFLLLILMGFWRTTGKVAWTTLEPWSLANGVSIAIYSLFLVFGAWSLIGMDAFRFSGITPLYATVSQIERESTPLNLNFWTRRSRNPAYFFTLCAFFITPTMTLDRLLIAALSLVYLVIESRFEEKRRGNQVGDPFQKYTQSVNRFFPSLKARV